MVRVKLAVLAFMVPELRGNGRMRLDLLIAEQLRGQNALILL